VFRRWVRRHPSLLATWIGSTVAVAIVATIAIVSTGFSAQRLDLNDASVWVANTAKHYIGRANIQVEELNTVVPAAGSDVDIVQAADVVLLADRSEAKLDIVDAATSSVLDTVALPPDQPQVFLAGSNVVIYSHGTGELWVSAIGDLSSFDAERAPSLTLGARAVVSVDPNGVLFAFSPEARQVYRVDAARAPVIQQTDSATIGSPTDDFQITSVGGAWAVLDVTTRQLESRAGLTDLAAAGVTGSAALQRASTHGDAVLIGYAGGLVSAAMNSSQVSPVASGHIGAPAAPITVAGCTYAAWTDGGVWRRCEGDAAAGQTIGLAGVSAAADLQFRSNGSRLVLNDNRDGSTWAVQADGTRIDNWDELIAVVTDSAAEQQNDLSQPPKIEKTQVPPVAIDDAFGARPGKPTVLSPLLNDYDANGDVLVITSVDSPDLGTGKVDIISQGQQLQLTVPSGASSDVTFRYTISDGRGGTATAKVTVDPHPLSENAAPVQVRPSKTNVISGGQVTLQVLGDWIDPDGDPIYLASSSTAGQDVASHRPDGELTFSDSGELATAEKTVSLIVSDGVDEGPGSLTVTVSPNGLVPIVTEPFVVLTYAGVDVRITPLTHVHGGNSVVRLNAVPPKNNVTITPNFQRGTFRFSSFEVGTHYIDYVVTDSVQTVTGTVRVDVAAPPETNTTPITVPKTVFVRTLSTQTVDVTTTDVDPSGGVLLVTGVMNVPTTSGIRAEILQHRIVRVTLARTLNEPQTFNYRISNGLAEAEGEITVIEIPDVAQLQPPIARDDTATVRVGDAVTIDVMANDEHPDGKSIRLDPKLVDPLSGDSGLLFASGNTLRYLAPNHPGNFTAVYQILGPVDQTAQAQVTIEVREPNVDTNQPPVPSRINSRVFAGEKVRIDIPLTGIDPDGDSVQLLGLETSPEKGSVTEVGSNYLVYTAGSYSAGTDTFTYSLIDGLGARATGIVRVGISEPLDGARNPIATADEVNVRPGATVYLQVLANDSDPDGRPLTVTSATPNGEEGAELTTTVRDGTIVAITAPQNPTQKRYGVLYAIANDIGGTSSNFISVVVAADAPLAYPAATDTVLTLSDILDQSTVDVDVLANVFFADGDASTLGVSLLPGYQGSQVLSNKVIRVTVGNKSQIIPFAVTHPADPTIVSYAFIWVPGYDDALPQLDRRANPVQVNSEASVTIELNDYVIAVGGKRVQLTDSSTVSATHSDGESLVVDADTLRYTSADLYYGPASVTFEVTDGATPRDPAGHTAILILPIDVQPRENQPPGFTGAVIDFEPGQEKTVQLVQLTNYPYAADRDELAYTVASPAPAGFTYSLDGQILTLRAEENTPKGTTTSIGLGVRDAVNTGQGGSIELNVVPSTRPLPQPVADTALTKRGQSTTIDVLANDEPTNPFPGQPLRVVQVAGADGASLPPGVAVSVSKDNSRITVQIGASAEPVDVNLQYEVADATGDPDRFVWGIVRISIQDVPDPPAKLVRQANTFVNGELKVRIAPAQQNNSAVTDYRVVSSSHGSYTHDCGTTLICTLPGLDVGALYTFQVIATNAIGDSAPSQPSDPYSIDYLPSAPTGVTAAPSSAATAPTGGSIDVNWTTVADPSPGTPVVGYTIVVRGATSQQVSASTTSATIAGLDTDVQYTVEVYARNSAQVTADTDWNRASTSVHTIGVPRSPSPAPSAVSATNGDIVVSWGDSDPNGGGVVSYSIARVDGAASPGDCTTVAAIDTGVSSPWTDTTSIDGNSYSYFIYSDNGTYCSAAGTGAITSLTAPGVATGTASVLHNNSGHFDIHADSISASGTVNKYQYFLSSEGTWRDVPSDDFLVDTSGAYYGQTIDVRFRACRDDSNNYCGDPSATTTLTPVNSRVTVATCVVGSPPTIQTPTNSAAVVATFEVSYFRADLLWSPFGSDSDPVPGDATMMRVKATVEGHQDPGYSDDVACTS
jgi:large repetitive protein